MDVNAYKARTVLDGGEQLAVALHLPSWCPKLQRGTKSAFQHFDTSVSRVAITPIAELVELFKEEIGRGVRIIEGYGLCYVQDVIAIAAASTTTEFVVTADPLPKNPAHAEIIAFNKGKESLRKHVPDGLAKKLADLLEVHVLVSCAANWLSQFRVRQVPRQGAATSHSGAMGRSSNAVSEPAAPKWTN